MKGTLEIAFISTWNCNSVFLPETPLEIRYTCPFSGGPMPRNTAVVCALLLFGCGSNPDSQDASPDSASDTDWDAGDADSESDADDDTDSAGATRCLFQEAGEQLFVSCTERMIVDGSVFPAELQPLPLDPGHLFGVLVVDSDGHISEPLMLEMAERPGETFPHHSQNGQVLSRWISSRMSGFYRSKTVDDEAGLRWSGRIVDDDRRRCRSHRAEHESTPPPSAGVLSA